jgi:hypothetical protein
LSFDISLVDPVTKETLLLDSPHMMQGGTYAVNGTDEAWLNVTYNYAVWYCKDGVFENKGGIRSINGTSGAESIPILQKAIEALSSADDSWAEEKIKGAEAHGITGYWLPTRENAMKPLYQLIALARARPDGVWLIE